jgi:hypothetical protein
MHKHRRAIIGAEPLATAQASIVVSEFPLNAHESFRAEIFDRQDKSIVAISRWKKTSSGRPKRTGVAFEFAAHRTGAVANILNDLQRVLASLDIDGGAA